MTDPRIEALITAAQAEGLSFKHAISGDDDQTIAARILAAADAAAWRPITEAKKNGTPILAKLRDDIYPPVTEASSLREKADFRWNGLTVVLRHPGLADSGFDMGWNMQAPVGHGGFPDDWIDVWQPLAAPPGDEVKA